MKLRSLAALTALMLPQLAHADQVGEIGVDWSGNDIVIEAVNDPEIDGVTCHVAYFERGLVDRLANGNWFEDPSNASIACRQTGPIDMDAIEDIDKSEDGEDVFRASRSIVFKSLRVKRIFDADNQTLIYVIHGREIVRGSAKVAISTVPLYAANQ